MFSPANGPHHPELKPSGSKRDLYTYHIRFPMLMPMVHLEKAVLRLPLRDLLNENSIRPLRKSGQPLAVGQDTLSDSSYSHQPASL